MKQLTTILLCLIAPLAMAQVYTPANLFSTSEYLGYTYHPEAAQLIRDKINQATQMDELPDYVPFINTPDKYSAFQLVRAADGYKLVPFNFTDNSAALSDLLKRYALGSVPEKGMPLKAYGFYQLDYLQTGKTYALSDFKPVTGTYYDVLFMVTERLEAGSIFISHPVRYSGGDETGFPLLNAYIEKVKALQKNEAAKDLAKRQEEAEQKRLNVSAQLAAQREKDAKAREQYLKERKAMLIAEYGEKDGLMIFEGSVKLGFTKDQCVEAWGQPSDINRTISESSVHEQWVYEKSDYQHQYLYFEGDRLTTIQD